MSVILTGFLRLHLTSCSKILYDFTINYNTQVNDSSGNSNHGLKTAIGSATSVNTPYGLYLQGDEVGLPPNTYAGSGISNVVNSSDDFSMSVFVRFLQGKNGKHARPIVTFKSGKTTRLQLQQPAALNTAAPVFELTVDLGGTVTTLTSATYTLSKLYADQWYFFVISVDSQIGSSLVSMCINGGAAQSATHNQVNPKDFSANTLNEASTYATYYSFQFEDTANVCSFFGNRFDLGGSCTYVCYEGGGVPCNVNTIQFDTTCTSCGASCGNYGCVQASPLICYDSSCPPATYTDANCNACYANSGKTVGVDSCSCLNLYTQTVANPLTCVSSCTTVATVYTANLCPTCYTDSYNDAGNGTCTCNTGYFNAGAPSVVCTGEE
jgi:hypothetical protein